MNETISKHSTVMGSKTRFVQRWLAAFELFADNANNANKRQRRRALMLHLAGPAVQDIFLNLPNTGDVKDYRKAVAALNAYLAPKVDTTYARHCF